MKLVLVAGIALLLCAIAYSQQTVGLFLHTERSLDSGYVLFAPVGSTTTFLIDKCGKSVHSWPDTHRPFQSVYLLPDGTLVRTGSLAPPNSNQGPGIVEKIAWDGTVVWSYTLPDSTMLQHHDIEPMPNGNILVIFYEVLPPDALIAAGRDTTLVGSRWMSERVMELEPHGTDSARVVWQWRANDHIVQEYDPTKPNYGKVADHPELIDVNYLGLSNPQKDWLHFNAVKYNAELDQVLVSVLNFSEVWIIDHATTTAEAAAHAGGRRGHGGDLLYRWGNPQAYGQGTAADQKFFGQHGAYWIPRGMPHAGEIMVFNNGNTRPGAQYSSVEMFSPAVDSDGNYEHSVTPYLPAAQSWIYTDTPATALYSPVIGSAQMLVNGNVLVCNGQNGIFFEIDSARTKTWYYVNPMKNAGPTEQGAAPVGTQTFRCTFYPYSYPGFRGHTLVAGLPLEAFPLDYTCQLNIDTSGTPVRDAQTPMENDVVVYPNPAADHIACDGNGAVMRMILYNALGQEVAASDGRDMMNTAQLPAGLYHMRVRSGGKEMVRTVVIVH